MATSNTLAVQVSTVNGSIDKAAFMAAADEAITSHIAEFEVEAKGAEDAIASALGSPSGAKTPKFTSQVLANLAISLSGGIPDAKSVEKMAVLCEAFCAARPDTYLVVRGGRNAGLWNRALLEPSQLAKLTQTAAAE